MSEEIVVGRRYTLVIPKSIREELGLEEGQRAFIYIEGGKIVIEPFPGDPFKALGDVIGEPYVEAKEEAQAEKWVKKRAGR